MIRSLSYLFLLLIPVVIVAGKPLHKNPVVKHDIVIYKKRKPVSTKGLRIRKPCKQGVWAIEPIEVKVNSPEVENEILKAVLGRNLREHEIAEMACFLDTINQPLKIEASESSQ